MVVLGPVELDTDVMLEKNVVDIAVRLDLVEPDSDVVSITSRRAPRYCATLQSWTPTWASRTSWWTSR